MGKVGFFLFFLLSMGVLHTASPLASIVINEILYNPNSLDSDEEFVELYNPSSQAMDVSGWALRGGIHFTFAKGTVIEAGQYLVLSPSPDTFRVIYGGLEAIGPYQGHLNNDGERIELIDSHGALVERVDYIDEQGWPQSADGYGPSLERIHPEMAGSRPESWRAGPIGGTPLSSNANQIDHPVAIIHDVRQTPTAPTSFDSVHVFCHLLHVRPIERMILRYKTESETIYQTTEMFDDGQHDDGRKADGLYSGVIPPHADGAIVEFVIEAVDTNGERGWYPLEGTQKSPIYLVNDAHYQTSLPLYRIVLREADNQLLRSRDARSDDELPASFIYDEKIRYNVGLRFRGKGSRWKEPKSYRVNFTDTDYFDSIRKLNLNAIDIYNQYIGLECFHFLHMPAPEKKFVSLAFNQVFVPSYIQVERTDQSMMERLFGDGNGNLYRGVDNAELDYRGEDPDRYRSSYIKETNPREDDYTDLIELCYAFSETSDPEFVLAISRIINVQQWIRWFAIKEILNDREGGLSLNRGDDYFLYHNPRDGLFYLLPWDLDTLLVYPIEAVHHHTLPAVRRLLRHPDLARFYYAELLHILDEELTQSAMDAIIDQTAPVANETLRDQLKQISRDTRASIQDSIPRALTLETELDTTRTLVLESDLWNIHRGWTPPPPHWNQSEFDASGWEMGSGGFGYGDNDDQTLLEDMRNGYSTVFIRKSFMVSDPAAIERLVLTALYDDGFVAYLNGVEIARDNVSGEPLYDSFADRSSEADTPALYTLDDPQSVLVAGENTLAVVGLNHSLDSSDFSLAVRLEGFSKRGEWVQLQGTADATRTRWVRVNGEEAQYEPWLANWSHSLELKPGRNLITIQGLNAAGQIAESTRVALYNGSLPASDGQETVGDEIWTASQSPIRMDRNLIVHAADTLIIQSGVHLQMAPAAGIIVFGTLTVEGTEELPVRFEPQNEKGTWGTIVIDHAGGTVQFHHAEWIRSASMEFRGSKYSAAVNIVNSTVEFDGCLLTQGGAGIEAQFSNLTVRNSTFLSQGEMLHCNTCWAIVENNRFENAMGYSDAIDFDYELRPGSLIRYNTIIGSDDDAIDIGDASPRIEGNWIQGCFNKGISLEGPSAPILINNVILQCEYGIAVKDGCSAQIAHTTIVSCTSGISVYEKNLGRGGGQAELINCVIWNTQQSLRVDSLSLANVRYSDLMQLPTAHQETNYSYDPLFVNSADHDYHPQLGSPLLDAGLATSITTDFDGNPRPSGPAPDVGAFERQNETSVLDWFLHQ